MYLPINIFVFRILDSTYIILIISSSMYIYLKLVMQVYFVACVLWYVDVANISKKQSENIKLYGYSGKCLQALYVFFHIKYGFLVSV